jgi:aminoglycoside 2''-phosphotransferase
MVNKISKVQHYIQKIYKYYPNLAIDTVKFNRDGQYNDVLIVNESLVFRFDKVHTGIKSLRQEIRVLQNLQAHISLQIPNPLYVNIDPEDKGDGFIGYQMIPGTPLWRENFQKITNIDARKKIAAQLASFLQSLHQISVPEIGSDLPRRDNPQEWEEMYFRIQDKLYPAMRQDARRQVSEHFENFLDQSDRYVFEPKLRHGDFGPGNIIYNPKSLSIVGIIDFGAIALGDPARDFAGLFISYGEEFYKMCTSIYPEMGHTYDRAIFYCGTFALQEALFGVENDDNDAYHAGMEEYV